MTERDLEIFSIDKFITESLNLDWFDLFNKCQTTGQWAEKYHISRKEPDFKYKQSVVLNFAKFIGELCFILHNNGIVIPAGMSKDEFIKVKPIIEKFIASGNLKKEWLTLYNDL